MAQNDYPKRSFPKPPWDIFDLAKLKLKGKPWSRDDNAAPNCTVKVHNGNPRFRLYMNNTPGSTNSKTVAVAPFIFSQMLETVKLVAENTATDKYTFDIKESYMGGQKLDKPMVTSRVTIGRDTEGYVYLAFSFKGEKDPAIFLFQDDYFASLQDATGESLNVSLCSSLMAKGWARLMENMFAIFLVTQTKDPEAGKEKQSNAGSSNSSYSKTKPADAGWDDDVSF